MKTINVTVRELYDNFVDSAKEYFWQEPDAGLNIRFTDVMCDLCKCENRSEYAVINLRKYFKEKGLTVFLMGDKMKELDSLNLLEEVEIRVYNSNFKNLVCVLVNNEIDW